MHGAIHGKSVLCIAKLHYLVSEALRDGEQGGIHHVWAERLRTVRPVNGGNALKRLASKEISSHPESNSRVFLAVGMRMCACVAITDSSLLIPDASSRSLATSRFSGRAVQCRAVAFG